MPFQAKDYKADGGPDSDVHLREDIHTRLSLSRAMPSVGDGGASRVSAGAESRSALAV